MSYTQLDWTPTHHRLCTLFLHNCALVWANFNSYGLVSQGCTWSNKQPRDTTRVPSNRRVAEKIAIELRWNCQLSLEYRWTTIACGRDPGEIGQSGPTGLACVGIKQQRRSTKVRLFTEQEWEKEKNGHLLFLLMVTLFWIAKVRAGISKRALSSQMQMPGDNRQGYLK